MHIFKTILLTSAGLTTLSTSASAELQKPTEVVVRREKRFQAYGLATVACAGVG